MTTAILSSPEVKQDFPTGTTDPGFTYTITGTLADGTPFSTSTTDTASSVSFDLQPGTYTGTKSKLGLSSQASASLTITAPATVTLSVPDVNQPATLA